MELTIGTILILVVFIVIFIFVNFTRYVETSGFLRPSKYHIIRTDIAGFIKNIYFEDGDIVKKDDILVELDTEDTAIDFLSIEKEVENKNKELERLYEYLNLLEKKFEVDKAKEEYNLNKSKVLKETGGITPFQFEKIKFDYESFILSYELSKSEIYSDINAYEIDLSKLVAQRDKLKLIIDKSKITSVADGILVNVSSEPLLNKLLKIGDPICYIYEDSNLIAEIKIPESQMAKVSKGQKVEITINAFPKEEYKIFEGTLSYISSDSIEGFYRAEVLLDTKTVNVKTKGLEEEKRLLFGLGLKAKINTGKGNIFDILFKNQ